MIPENQHLVLVGMMGVGKTTVSRIVGERLGRRVVDSDLVIEARTGRTVREIFATDGEPAFRDLEERTIAGLVGDPTVRVIATGGGAVLSAATRRCLHDQAVVIWLRATYPRLREDQRQRFSWLVLIPLSLAMIMVVAVVKVATR